MATGHPTNTSCRDPTAEGVIQGQKGAHLLAFQVVLIPDVAHHCSEDVGLMGPARLDQLRVCRLRALQFCRRVRLADEDLQLGGVGSDADGPGEPRAALPACRGRVLPEAEIRGLVQLCTVQHLRGQCDPHRMGVCVRHMDLEAHDELRRSELASSTCPDRVHSMASRPCCACRESREGSRRWQEQLADQVTSAVGTSLPDRKGMPIN